MGKKEARSPIGPGMKIEGEAPPWVSQFLAGLIVTGNLRQTLDEAEIDFDTAWRLREAEPAFAYYWDKALRVHKSGALLALAAGRHAGALH